MKRYESIQVDPPPEALLPDTQPRATAAPDSSGAAFFITLDLPFPPSTNAIWRHARGRMYRSKKYLDWMNQADLYVISTRQMPKRKIHGPFGCSIRLNRDAGRGDGDNRIKAVLDWAQSREIIRNDSDCQRGSWAWVDPDGAPQGCRLTLWSIPSWDVT